MVFDKIKKAFKARNDPHSLKGLEQFTPAQQKKILGKIGNKEAEIMELKANAIAIKRMERLERRAGLRKKSKDKGVDIISAVKKFKKFRQNNLKKNEGNDSGMLKVKPVKIKAPPTIK